MAWSQWKGSLAIVLFCAGLAWAQAPVATTSTDNTTDIFLTVGEPGKAPQKCRLLYCWIENGVKYCQVQAVDTQELMTLIDPPLPSGAPELVTDQAHPRLATKIFRWGSSTTCPPGFPQPPAGLTCQSCGGNGSAIAGGSSVTSGPATACSSCGNKGSVVVSDAPTVVTPSNGTTTVTVSSGPVVMNSPAPQRQTLWQRLFGKGQPEPTSTVVTPPKVGSPTAAPPVVVVKDKPGNGSQSVADLASGAPNSGANQTPGKVVGTTLPAYGDGSATGSNLPKIVTDPATGKPVNTAPATGDKSTTGSGIAVAPGVPGSAPPVPPTTTGKSPGTVGSAQNPGSPGQQPSYTGTPNQPGTTPGNPGTSGAGQPPSWTGNPPTTLPPVPGLPGTGTPSGGNGNGQAPGVGAGQPPSWTGHPPAAPGAPGKVGTTLPDSSGGLPFGPATGTGTQPPTSFVPLNNNGKPGTPGKDGAFVMPDGTIIPGYDGNKLPYVPGSNGSTTTTKAGTGATPVLPDPSAVAQNTANVPPIPPPPTVTYPGYPGATAKASDKGTLPGVNQPGLPVAKNTKWEKSDPLANPSQLMPDAAKKKLELDSPPPLPSGKGSTSGITAISTGGPTVSGQVALANGYPPMDMQRPGGGGYPPNYGIPLGAQSVHAAYNGMNLQREYLPTPIVTVPAPTKPPYPPPPELPHAPQPVPYENAFTPPGGAGGQAGGNPMVAGNPYGYPSPMMPPGYGSPMMPPGYGMPPQYAMMPPAMYPPSPMVAQGYGYPSTPANPMGLMRNYSGPMPPSPVQGQGVAQASYQPLPFAGYPYYPATFANPAMDRPAMPAAAPAGVPAQEAVYQLLMTLKTSPSPSQREWAVMGLAKYDWHNQPHLLQGLLVAAREDQAATVRVACVKTLVRIGVAREVYAGTLQTMRNDADPRVQQAVAEALGEPVPAAAANPVTTTGHSEKR